MTHDDLIAEVAKRLEWPEEKTAGIIEAILEVMSTELKMSNPVVIDNFGTLKTDIQPEYILMNPGTKERHLMPPAVEVVFEALFQENEENTLLRAGFTPDEALYNEVNSSFSQFEPTPLNEGVQFPGIPEIVAGEPEEESETPEIIEPTELTGQTEPVGLPEIIEPPEPAERKESVEQTVTIEPVKTPVQTQPAKRTGQTGVKESPPQYRSSRGLRSNKRTSSVWIPIAGGVAIIVASLFFFKGDRNR